MYSIRLSTLLWISENLRISENNQLAKIMLILTVLTKRIYLNTKKKIKCIQDSICFFLFDIEAHKKCPHKAIFPSIIIMVSAGRERIQVSDTVQGDPKFRPPLPSEDRKFL